MGSAFYVCSWTPSSDAAALGEHFGTLETKHLLPTSGAASLFEGEIMRADLPKLITMVAIVVITLCAVISTIVLLQMRQQMNDLYNVTAKPHCYLSPNDPRRRNIETQWGTTPTSQGICDKESQRAD